MKKSCLLVVVLFLFLLNNLSAQNTSNRGKDFWVAYNGHVDELNSRLTLFLSADQATTYEVYIGDKLIQSGSINANTCLPVIINPNSQPVYVNSSDQIENNKAIRVLSAKPISLYSVISYNARTGGTMVLPANTLGKEYYTFNYRSSIDASGNVPVYAQFTIVAVEDGTDVEITPTVNEKNGKHQAHQTFTKKLNKGDIYQYQAIGDLSGSYVRSVNGCKPIAVFSGNTWASFCEPGNPRAASGGDNLYQQLFPLASWGKKFVTAPFYNTQNGNTEAVRIIVAEDNTTISVNGSTGSAGNAMLSNPYNKGAIVTFYSNGANAIEADKPIAVALYQTSQTCNLNNPTNNSGPIYPGDPEITVLNPVEQTLNNITVYSRLDNVPTNINRFFLNVIIKTADAPSFRLNGNPIAGFIAIDQEYSYKTIDVTNLQSQHRLTASGGFSAIAYGYGSFESYAYLAGANIQDFTFQPEIAGTSQSITNGCLGLTMQLKINLPYLPTRLEWDVQNGDGRIVQSSPQASGSFVRNGMTYYTFLYPRPITYNVAGDYTFSVVATKPSADACGATEELSIDFTVDPLPTAAIIANETACAGKEIQFSSAQSTSNVEGKALTKWIWDFGDGTLSTVQNPKHVFTTTISKTVEVKLTVGAENGCFSVPIILKVLINPTPEVKVKISFNAVSTTASQINTCINTPVRFEDQSIIGAGAVINSWYWDFGDQQVSNLQNPIHAFSKPGLYRVKFVAASNTGCASDTLYRTINVTDLPVNDFVLPEVCAQDALAIFKNISTDYNQATSGIVTYQWDFGDPGAGTLNTSSEREGRHKYSVAGTYPVRLTIINESGCSVTVEKLFTVNDSKPEADFEVVNTSFCSNKSLVLKNTSRVDIGSISRLIWYINGAEMLTDEDPLPGKLYTFDLPSFGGNADRVYAVRLAVFSGETCANQVTRQVTLKPSPQINFGALMPVCENDTDVKIVQGLESSGITGRGVYSGKGVKADGSFDPKLAGPGIHLITYTFTADSGCDSTLTREMMVFESPTADAGPQLFVLSGNAIKIPAKAAGKNVSYKWTPAKGLDRDDVLNPMASPDEDTAYTLTVTTDEGCSATTNVFVKVLGEVKPPSSFSPNGDGINDVWKIDLLASYPGNTVEIFTRGGQKVFESKGYEEPFDGNFQNKPLPVGVYYYVISPKNGRKTITGSLTLIR